MNMAYFNSGFPATYQPLYQQTYTPVQAQQQNVAPVQQPVQQGINWIQGEQAAKSYLVAPNNSVVLFDSESQTIFIKSADASGMPSMKVLDYTIRETGKNGANLPVASHVEDLSIYATKEEIKAVSEQLTMLRERVETMAKKRRREDDDE